MQDFEGIKEILFDFEGVKDMITNMKHTQEHEELKIEDLTLINEDILGQLAFDRGMGVSEDIELGGELEMNGDGEDIEHKLLVESVMQALGQANNGLEFGERMVVTPEISEMELGMRIDMGLGDISEMTKIDLPNEGLKRKNSKRPRELQETIESEVISGWLDETSEINKISDGEKEKKRKKKEGKRGENMITGLIMDAEHIEDLDTMVDIPKWLQDVLSKGEQIQEIEPVDLGFDLSQNLNLANFGIEEMLLGPVKKEGAKVYQESDVEDMKDMGEVEETEEMKTRSELDSKMDEYSEDEELNRGPTSFIGEDGIPYLSFSYTVKGRLQRHTIRRDVDKVKISEIPETFRLRNCVYPRAHCSFGNYSGNRWKYETECNDYGWRLAFLNQEKLAEKRGMLQRAVDSYRNLMFGRKNRRTSKQMKLMQPEYVIGGGNDVESSAAEEKTRGSKIKAKVKGKGKSKDKSKAKGKNKDAVEKMKLDVGVKGQVIGDNSDMGGNGDSDNGVGADKDRTKEDSLASAFRQRFLPANLQHVTETFHTSSDLQPKMLLVDVFSHSRFNTIRIKADIAQVTYDVPKSFIDAHALYPRASGKSKERYGPLALGRWAFEVSCNEIAWKLAWLNKPRLTNRQTILQKCVDAYRWRVSSPPVSALQCLAHTPEVHSDLLFLTLWVPRWGRRQLLSRIYPDNTQSSAVDTPLSNNTNLKPNINTNTQIALNPNPNPNPNPPTNSASNPSLNPNIVSTSLAESISKTNLKKKLPKPKSTKTLSTKKLKKSPEPLPLPANTNSISSSDSTPAPAPAPDLSNNPANTLLNSNLLSILSNPIHHQNFLMLLNSLTPSSNNTPQNYQQQSQHLLLQHLLLLQQHQQLQQLQQQQQQQQPDLKKVAKKKKKSEQSQSSSILTKNTIYSKVEKSSSKPVRKTKLKKSANSAGSINLAMTSAPQNPLATVPIVRIPSPSSLSPPTITTNVSKTTTIAVNNTCSSSSVGNNTGPVDMGQPSVKPIISIKPKPPHPFPAHTSILPSTSTVNTHMNANHTSTSNPTPNPNPNPNPNSNANTLPLSALSPSSESKIAKHAASIIADALLRQFTNNNLLAANPNISSNTNPTTTTTTTTATSNPSTASTPASSLNTEDGASASVSKSTRKGSINL